MALFVCAHVGVMFDWEVNKQQLLQGHVSSITVFIHVDLNLKHCLRSYTPYSKMAANKIILLLAC